MSNLLSTLYLPVYLFQRGFQEACLYVRPSHANIQVDIRFPLALNTPYFHTRIDAGLGVR